MSTFYGPPCPYCKTTTMLPQITPGGFGLSIRTLECPACDYVGSVELADPMKSPLTNGWLNGQLQAPT